MLIFAIRIDIFVQSEFWRDDASNFVLANILNVKLKFNGRNTVILLSDKSNVCKYLRKAISEGIVQLRSAFDKSVFASCPNYYL